MRLWSRVLMTSEDVIHSFFVPDFRIKQDVVPGRYTSISFTPSRAGEYRLFCAEYCGLDHAVMGGRIVVMRQAEYARWLSEGPRQPGMAARGFELYRQYGFTLFRELGCSGCHGPESTVHAPRLDDLPGRTVHLQDGRAIVADDNYIRDSILLPRKDVVAGFEPIMPSFAGQIGEEDILAITEYIRESTHDERTGQH